MTDKKILNNRIVGGDYFFFQEMKSSKYKLEHFLTFDKDDYWIYKKTRKQREVSYEEFLEFKSSGYIFFKKELYDKEDINKWIDFIGQFGGMMYFNRPLPPIEVMDKIKIKK